MKDNSATRCKGNFTLEFSLWYNKNVKDALHGGAMKNKLSELRMQHSITQIALAEKLDVSRQTIISIENGKYNPSLELAFKISNVFETRIEDIFIFEGENHED